MNETKSFGASLRQLRKSKMLSLVQLSEQSGVSNPYLSQIENDKFVPSLEILRKLAVALDHDIYTLALNARIYSEEDLTMLQRHDRKSTFADDDFTYEAYKSHYHVQLEDFIKDSGRSFYIAGHKLNDNELQALVQLFEGKEKNYPTDEALKEGYEKLK